MTTDFELVERAGILSEWRHRGNGLTVLVGPTPVAPVVGFGVVYRVGSRHEVEGHTGATHILEHLMFKGTGRYNRERGTEIARELHRVGAFFNASTWLDRTNYYEVLPVDRLPLAVDIEADRMRGALVREADLSSERTVVLNELDSGDNEPFELLMKGSFAHAFLEHPYRHPTIGWRSDVEHMSAAVLRGFYDTYYHPDNATVIVVGDIDESAALAAVEAKFGAIPAASGPFPQPTSCEEVQRGERRFEIHRSGELPCLVLTWHIPPGLHQDLPALSVLTQVLGDGVTARLHQRLVETNRCLGVHAYAMELHDPGVFQIFATLAPGIGRAEVEEAVRAEVAALRAAPPAVDELARALTQTRTDLAFHHESPGQIVSGLTEAVAMGDWRRFVRELELVEAVTGDDLQRVAAAHLHDRNLTVGWFIPEGDGGASLPATPRPQPCYLERPFAERVAIRELPSGARLAVVDNPHAPTLTVAGTLRAGPALAPDGRFAVPGLTAATLDRGTADFDRMQLARGLEDHGLQLTVRASAATPTIVSFSAQGLAEEAPRLIELLIEVLRRPTFPEDELEKLRRQVLGSLVREREDTHANAFAALTRALYPAGHPLRRRPLAEREREVEGVTREDLAAFHEAAYGPGGMVVAVVGRIEADRVAALLAAAMEGWLSTAAMKPAWPEDGDPEPSAERIQIDDRPGIDVFLGHRGRLLRGAPDFAAAVLANSCLGQSTLTSRLGVAVRDEAGLTYGVSSRFFGTVGVAGPWATALGVAAQHLERAVELSRSVIARYVGEGPGEAELADERTALAGAYRVGLATNAGIARELVTALTTGEGAERLDRFPVELLTATRDQVMDALRRHIQPERLVMTAAGDFGDV
jgi:zinc protease